MSEVLYVYRRPAGTYNFFGVPERDITEAEWARFSPIQRRTVADARVHGDAVWVHRDLIDETEEERLERERREREEREAAQRAARYVRGVEFDTRTPAGTPYEPLDIWDAFDRTGTNQHGPGWLAIQYQDWINGINTHFQRELSNGTITRTDRGASSDGQHVYSYTAGNPHGATVLLVAGTHGEFIGIHAAMRFFEQFVRANDPLMRRLRQAFRVIYIPNVTPFIHNGGRVNANGVNINRNFDFAWADYTPNDPVGDAKGSAPFSEPEAQIVRDIVLAEKPSIYFDCHNYGQGTGNFHEMWAPSPYVLGPRRFLSHVARVTREVYGRGEVDVRNETDTSPRMPYSMDWFTHRTRWVHGDVSAAATTLESGVDMFGSVKETHTSRRAMQVYCGSLVTFLALWLEERGRVNPAPYTFEMAVRRPSPDAVNTLLAGGTLIHNRSITPLWWSHAEPSPIPNNGPFMRVPTIYTPAVVTLSATGSVSATGTSAPAEAGNLEVMLRLDGALQGTSKQTIQFTTEAGRHYPFTVATTFTVTSKAPAHRSNVELVFYQPTGTSRSLVVQPTILTARVSPHTDDAQSFRVY